MDKIEHGGNVCADTRWFKCGACHRKCCWCFGGGSELRAFQNLCNDCWVYATAQAKREHIDVEKEAAVVQIKRDYRKRYRERYGVWPPSNQMGLVF